MLLPGVIAVSVVKVLGAFPSCTVKSMYETHREGRPMQALQKQFPGPTNCDAATSLGGGSWR